MARTLNQKSTKKMNSNLQRAVVSAVRMPVRTGLGKVPDGAESLFPLCQVPAVLPPQRPEDSGKLTVVLDIDETLIHTDMHGALEKQVKNNSEADKVHYSDVTSDHFHINLDRFRFKVYRRPHLEWFLKEAAAKFELVTFTAGEMQYASKVLSEVDPEQKLIRHRFFRHNCTQLGSEVYTKDLTDLNRPLNRVVLVDNNPICFLANPENGIPVSSFYAQRDDTTLKTLMNFLDHLNGKVDVRPVLKDSFRLNERLVRYYSSVIPAATAKKLPGSGAENPSAKL